MWRTFVRFRFSVKEVVCTSNGFYVFSQDFCSVILYCKVLAKSRARCIFNTQISQIFPRDKQSQEKSLRNSIFLPFDWYVESIQVGFFSGYLLLLCSIFISRIFPTNLQSNYDNSFTFVWTQFFDFYSVAKIEMLIYFNCDDAINIYWKLVISKRNNGRRQKQRNKNVDPANYTKYYFECIIMKFSNFI